MLFIKMLALIFENTMIPACGLQTIISPHLSIALP